MGNFSYWLRRRRRLLDLTQAALGQRVGCTEAMIRKIESGERKPSRQLAELLAQALEIPVEERFSFVQFARGIGEDAIPILRNPVAKLDNLLCPLTSLIGRQQDIDAVVAMLKDPGIRWVTLLGPPGIGKTRLSIESGRQALAGFKDGAWFVDLSQVGSPEFVLTAIARSLIPLGLPPSDNLDALANNLKNRHLLLILDNFEHVHQAAVEVAHLLTRCPELKVLATSRIPLHIYAEFQFPVPPLSVPPRGIVGMPHALMKYESVQLFVARVRQHLHSFSISAQNAAFIIDICSQLEGIPLVLELAAAALQRMNIEELDARLHNLRGENWIKQFASPALDLPVRQRTLENVIAWSFSLLAEAQQDLFCRLSIFSGWFEAEAVARVCFPEVVEWEKGIQDRLYELAEHSLLERGEFAGRAYWRMLGIIREFADYKLALKRRARLKDRHAHYFCDWLQTLFHQGPLADPIGFFQLHGQNFQAALDWSIESMQADLAYKLILGLAEIWEPAGYLKEGLAIIRCVLDTFDPKEPTMRLKIYEKASDLAWQQRDFISALGFAEAAMEISREHGLVDRLFWQLNRLGRIRLEQGDMDAAIRFLEEALIHAPNPGIPLAQLGEIALIQGGLDQAQLKLQQALTHLNAQQEEVFLAMALSDLAEVALAKGDFVLARDCLVKAYEPAGQHIRRLIYYLSSLAGYLTLLPGGGSDEKELAAGFFGAVEALLQGSGTYLSAFYQEVNLQRLQIIQSQIGGDIFHQAFKGGYQQHREAILEKVRGALGI